MIYAYLWEWFDCNFSCELYFDCDIIDTCGIYTLLYDFFYKLIYPYIVSVFYYKYIWYKNI